MPRRAEITPRAVLRDPAYRASAQRIAASMGQAGGMPYLAEVVDELIALKVEND